VSEEGEVWVFGVEGGWEVWSDGSGAAMSMWLDMLKMFEMPFRRNESLIRIH
jgi:hypothetical protein